MKLKSIEVVGLFNKRDEMIRYEFHDDLTILTGKNGSGKTTIMKLAWFIISGNILLALKEISFSSCIVHTSKYICTVTRTARNKCKIKLSINNNDYLFEDDELDDEISFFGDAEDKLRPFIIDEGSSIFFPTFRRIEGGFSISGTENILPRNMQRVISDFDEALADLSRRLSNGKHNFISAISSKDINNLLLRKYADYSEKINFYQQKVSAEAIAKISSFEKDSSSHISAEALLFETRKEIEKIEGFRKKTMASLNAVSELIEKLFHHSGISFGRRLSFGDKTQAIYSENLSAGEKQMLSFVCYNAFYDNSIFFIDEPELSLHVDWQRQLYPILKSQNKKNQFIFATHSPFIYSKYPDKEIIINNDKGFYED
ncbi:MAG: AAA family ATPase [[Actinobacillus] rossii]|nr:AAA family ATPase [[Actinobacillus] rossii]MDY5792805.1 AAA family ATPase [[Actinobacillus] rossii]